MPKDPESCAVRAVGGLEPSQPRGSEFRPACWGLTTATTRVVLTKPPLTRPTATAPPAPAPAPLCSDEGRSDTSRAVNNVRSAMVKPRAVRDSALDALLTISTDEHQNEDPSQEDRRLEYISGWWGEGLAVVLQRLPEIATLPAGGKHPGYSLPLPLNMSTSGAALWVPAGSAEQARQQVACSWDVFDRDDPSAPSLAQWLSDRLPKEARVGADPRLFEYAVWQELSAQLLDYRLQLVHVPQFLDDVWKADVPRRPLPSKVVAFIHGIEHTGVDWREKVAELRSELRVLGADAMVVTALDEIAWLLNLRGKDLPYSPLVKCFLLVTSNELHLYIPQGKLNVDVRNNLGASACYTPNCTHVHEYSDIYVQLRTRAQSWRTVLIPSASNFHRGASEAIVQSVPEAKRFLRVSPIIYMKAKKNPVEIRNMVRAQITDGVAMCQLLEYFERTYTNTGSKRKWDEVRLREETDYMRLAQRGNAGVALRTVVAFGAHSARPDYQPTNLTNARIGNNSTLVLKSGGQYFDGTAVVARTLHMGSPSAAHRRAYTRVLQASIAFSSLTFPGALPAAHADLTARAPLWDARRDYPHATGHGVGAFLNQREDPIKIDHNLVMNLDTFKEGYFVTNEPGWYERGEFGVRLGNVMQVVAAGGPYLAFRDRTLVPYEPKLIDTAALTAQEKQWLNAYHKRVREVLGPELKAQGMMEAYLWTMRKAASIQEPPARLVSHSAAAPPRAAAALATCAAAALLAAL